MSTSPAPVHSPVPETIIEDGETLTCFGSSLTVRPDSNGDPNEGLEPWVHDPLTSEVKVGEELDEVWTRKAYLELQEKSQWRQRDIQALREIVLGNCQLIKKLTKI